MGKGNAIYKYISAIDGGDIIFYIDDTTHEDLQSISLGQRDFTQLVAASSSGRSLHRQAMSVTDLQWETWILSRTQDFWKRYFVSEILFLFP